MLYVDNAIDGKMGKIMCNYREDIGSDTSLRELKDGGIKILNWTIYSNHNKYE